MGLDASVGLVAFYLEDEADSKVRPFTEDVAAVNDALREAGLPRFSEPPGDGFEPVELTLGPSSALQALRRVAAHAWGGRDVPEPTEGPAEEDPLLVSYYESRGEGDGEGPRFDHLVLHSDSSGYYVPFDFEAVIRPDVSSVLSGEVGSSQRLSEELGRLADLLGLPVDLDPDADELWRAYDSTPADASGWRCHGVESFVCARLLHASRASVERGALLAFG